MIKLLYSRGVFWPLILSVIGVTILVLLGNWQMARKSWKADLIKLVNERIASDVVAFDVLKQRSKVLEDIRYQPVAVSGVFDHTQERHYFLPLGARVGWHIITPLTTVDGDVVFVDRGFVPDKLKPQQKRLKGLPKGVVKLEGLARLAEKPNYFTPVNDLVQNKWYWRDLEGLYKSLSGASDHSLPFMIDLRRKGNSGEWPMPGVTRVKFTDKHLGYALTWYGLALTLIGVFVAFAFGRLFSGRASG